MPPVGSGPHRTMGLGAEPQLAGRGDACNPDDSRSSCSAGAPDGPWSIGGADTVVKQGGKNIASAVRETLDSVMSPSVRDAILARALAAGHMLQVPNDAAALGEFVQGPLHESLVHSLGPALGVSVTTELERIVALAAPHAPRQTSPQRDPSLPAAPAG